MQTVLIVDGEPLVRRYVADVLEEEGFDVLEAGDVTDAIETAQQAGKPIDLLITEHILPSCRSCDLLRQLSPQHPQMKTLIISSLYRKLLRHLDAPKRHWLTKPFSPERLQRRVRRLLAS